LRIDFINDGSHDGPLIRLLSDQVDEIKLLRDTVLKLGNSEIDEINISDLPISKSSNVKLIFRVCKSDSGVTINKNMREYIVSLSHESYLEMAEKLAPFINVQTGYAWLYESKTFYVLFTTDGYW
jgi:hypothetical protein